MHRSNNRNLTGRSIGLGIIGALWLMAGTAQAMPHAAQSADVAPIVVETAKTTTLRDALSRPAAQRLVYVGETHSSLSDHRLQLEVARQMFEQGGKLAIGVEWFQRRFQPVLDRYTSGEIDERTMLRETEYFERWGFDYRLYREILQFARDNGIRVLALNAEKELTNAVREQGLDGLTAEQRERLPANYDFDNGPYALHLQEIFKLHKNRYKDDPKAFQRFLEVQLTWDETMAQTVARALQADPEMRVLVLAGRGHTHAAAIPARVTRRAGTIGLSIASYQPGSPFEAADFMVLQPEQYLPPQGLIGVGLEERDDGVFIISIATGSKAGQAGIKVGDRITGIDGQAIETYMDIKLAMLDRSPGESLLVKLYREGLFGIAHRNFEAEVTLTPRREH